MIKFAARKDGSGQRGASLTQGGGPRRTVGARAAAVARAPFALVLLTGVGTVLSLGTAATAGVDTDTLFPSTTPGTHTTGAVPAGVCFVSVSASGGAGGLDSSGDSGGDGATVTATVPVTPETTLNVLVAGVGNSDGNGGVGGSGGGASGGGGGGGASVVASAAGLPLVVAGGGGGAGDGGGGVAGVLGSPGGNGSGTRAGSGGGTGGTGGGGGAVGNDGAGAGGGVSSAAASGAPGNGSAGGGGGGGGYEGYGYGSSGGVGGSTGTGAGGSGGGSDGSGGSGSIPGGNGGSGFSGGGGGGGGGGTGFGGGGGAQNSSTDAGGGGGGYGAGGGAGVGGGGGGSSYVIASATNTSSSVTNTGGGSVTITYDPVADACPTPTLTLSGNPEINSSNTYDVQLVVPSGAPAPSESVVVSDGTESCDAALSNPSHDGVTYHGTCTVTGGEALGATVTATYDADGGDPNYLEATSTSLTVGGAVIDEQVSINGTTWQDVGNGVLNDPTVLVGAPVYERVIVTDSGSDPIIGVSVTDGGGPANFTFGGAAAISLVAGENVTSDVATLTARAGHQTDTATVTGEATNSFNSEIVSASDQADYTGIVPGASIDEQVSINGTTWQDVGNGVLNDPTVLVGAPVYERVIVTDIGSDPITGVSVTYGGGPANFTFGGAAAISLVAGENVTSDVATLTARAGHQTDTATVTGEATDSVNSEIVSASDQADYTGIANTVSVTNPGTQSAIEGTAIAPLPITATDSGAATTLTYSATGLPPGLSIDTSTGLISGTPTSAAGSPYSVTVTVTDNDGFSGSATFSWGVTTNTVSVTNPGTQSAIEGTAIAPLPITATDSGAATTLTYSATGLPPGLSIDTSTGLISGTPTSAAGSPYSVTVTVTDNDGFSGSATFSWGVTVVNKVSLTNPGTQTSTTGSAVSLQLTGTDSGSLALTYSATGLPTGLSISTSGLITGKPTTAGTFSVQVSAKDASGANASVAFTWNVLPPTTIYVVAVPGGTLRTGSLVAYGVLVSKGSAAGTLTGTVSFTANGVAIAGCSNLHLFFGVTACVTSYKSAGSYAVVATYSGDPHFGSASTSLTEVVDQPPAFTSAATATATVGKSLSFEVTASGSPAPTFTESGTLPKGVTLSSTGLLSGTPAAGTAGSYAITITATNAGGTSRQKFTLVLDQPPAITNADSASATVGKSLRFSVTASGYPAPTFTESGTLPKGVTLSSTGLLSGTPAAGTAGSYAITITAKSTAGTVQQNFTLKVAA